MPIQLTDGSLVGDGTFNQIGMFPVLADTTLKKPSTLLRTSTNPRMDLVLLVVKDATSSSAPAATAPPGMSAAQFALIQRMAAARNRGAQGAAAGGGSPEPKRGPQIHLVLWRMGDDSSIVWSVVLGFDKVMDLAGMTQQEHEDVCLHDVAWSPKGDRVGVLASVRRSPVASTSTADARTSTFLRTYSVQDGRLLSTVQVGRTDGSNSEEDSFAGPMTLQWQDVEPATSSQDAVDASSEALLSKFPPLPALPPADTFASAGGGGNLMPHQLRMMQMSGQKPPPSFQFPSALAVQGRGPLAKIPFLTRNSADLGLVEGGDAMMGLNEDSALPLTPESVVLVSSPTTGNVCLVLDGQTSISSLQLPASTQEEQGIGQPSAPSRTLSLSCDMTNLTSLTTSASAATTFTQLQLPLPPPTHYGPTNTRNRLLTMTRTTHLLRFYLGYALDTASALQQVCFTEFTKKVTSEWTKNIDDLSMKFGGDMKYELINVLLTGRAGPAAEQFLLGNLTEGMLSRLEKDAHTAMYSLKKLISDSLRPSLERCIVCLTGLLGLARFFGREEHTGLEEALKVLQAALDAALSLAKEVDMEALISQEFYRWCRTERERQERIKQDQDEPRLPITYDVHTVAQYIERGFENEMLGRLLSDKVDAAAIESLLAGEEKKVSLKETLEKARTFLADPTSADNKANLQKDNLEARDVGKEGPLPIVPTLTRAIEMLGDQLLQLLDGNLENSAVSNTVSVPFRGEWQLLREAIPALSLSSTVDVGERSSHICTTSFVTHDTLLSAYILQSTSSRPTILAICTDSTTSQLAIAHFTISTQEPVTILDLGFYGDSELLVLANLPSTSTSVLLAFSLSDLPFGSDGVVGVMPSRATELEQDFKAGKMAVNMNKQTVAVIEEGGKRVVYLDVSQVTVEGMAMEEEG